MESKEEKQLRVLRARLLARSDINPKYESKVSNDDKFLERYLRKYKGDVERSQRAIENYMKLNEEVVRIHEFPKAVRDLCHCYFSGTDEGFVGVIPHAGKGLKQFMDESDEDTLQLLSKCILKSVMVVENLLEERKLDSVVFISDVGSIPYAQYFHRKTLEYAVHVVKMVVRHSPIMADGKYLVINAPWLFKRSLSFILSFVKIPAEIHVFNSGDDGWRKHIPEKSIPTEFGGSLTKILNIESLRDPPVKSKP